MPDGAPAQLAFLLRRRWNAPRNRSSAKGPISPEHRQLILPEALPGPWRLASMLRGPRQAQQRGRTRGPSGAFHQAQPGSDLWEGRRLGKVQKKEKVASLAGLRMSGILHAGLCSRLVLATLKFARQPQCLSSHGGVGGRGAVTSQNREAFVASLPGPLLQRGLTKFKAGRYALRRPLFQGTREGAAPRIPARDFHGCSLVRQSWHLQSPRANNGLLGWQQGRRFQA
ncbi:hypothetical protein NDU88_011318 [Pleurodeles waltl]|uniref:Uncharacterized protein n=1 Tax=Pleurodeles waltl TaxID=8319 RepID=A0AAV7QWW4_PLEWA|nr:hypothetical protein NDU88_011318 [Pleurodeles waltl]